MRGVLNPAMVLRLEGWSCGWIADVLWSCVRSDVDCVGRPLSSSPLFVSCFVALAVALTSAGRAIIQQYLFIFRDLPLGQLLALTPVHIPLPRCGSSRYKQPVVGPAAWQRYRLYTVYITGPGSDLGCGKTQFQMVPKLKAFRSNEMQDTPPHGCVDYQGRYYVYRLIYVFDPS